MQTLQISPNILRWAADQCGISLDVLVGLLGTPSKMDDYKAGKLSVAQTETLAQKTHIPFGYFFLETPPAKIERSLPDLRQLPDHAPLSVDFFDTLDDVLRKQQWYQDYLRDRGAQPLSFVGKFAFRSNQAPAVIANDIRKTFNISEQDRLESKDYKAFYNLLSEKAESIGILVFRSGIVKSNTKRGLSFDEFRGFAISDALAPVIFINGKDSQAAWIFTLAHELEHIWLGESGVSDVAANQPNQVNLETYCNRIAAELLTPEREFMPAWEQTPNQYDLLSKKFKVSQLVIARRALDLGKIDWIGYQTIATASKSASKSDGGSPFRSYPIRNSKRLTNAIVANAVNGQTMLREAASLLNIRPETVLELGKRLGIK
ncbi:ImmA/IrrE family metallo-endopeptidase [Methylicorpusculum sp.]|uniref:ImmA/IrrE family metallo-endopeptidase n=1 Tax=Methylicorpusculum sp. TaxID=2713644 RepID=UPI0027300CC4|nr:ImmA/IrrE family metallo-endopeptidase [Methylicorpusculum sp.]MDP2177268.1 ImmA/IrrE family metallo-endopeptidase [Methylicorpusculum sp.]MDP3531193.1 ImmA/IrrE family metallo-endopeptidase [Methylicorpusculum sp.]